MEIRYACENDYAAIAKALRPKHMSYNTPAHAAADIAAHRLIIAVENNKIVGQVALVPEPDYNYTALKRMCVYNKKNCSRGIGRFLFDFAESQVFGSVGATPFAENHAAIAVLVKRGYTFQYAFGSEYCFYRKVLR